MVAVAQILEQSPKGTAKIVVVVLVLFLLLVLVLVVDAVVGG